MSPELPVHPLVVHLPLALAGLMPVIAAAATAMGWRGWLDPRRLWVAVLALQVLLAGAAFYAKETGQDEEERVEKVVAHPLIHEHEEAAEAFTNAAAGALFLALVPVLLRRDGPRRWWSVGFTAASLVVLALAVRTGELGGGLVYHHGAASAYAGGGPPQALSPPETDND